MENEILFKGQVINSGDWDGTWIEGSLTVKPSGGMNISRWCPITEHWNDENVNPETVGQLCPFTIKNGQRVFGGDIIDTMESFPDDTPQPSVIVMGKFGWCYKYLSKDFITELPITEFHVENCTVVGNIHDKDEVSK